MCKLKHYNSNATGKRVLVTLLIEKVGTRNDVYLAILFYFFLLHVSIFFNFVLCSVINSKWIYYEIHLTALTTTKIQELLKKQLPKNSSVHEEEKNK